MSTIRFDYARLGYNFYRYTEKLAFDAYLRKGIGRHAFFLELIKRPYKIKFDPSQPRVPAGRPDAGQWTREYNRPQNTDWLAFEALESLVTETIADITGFTEHGINQAITRGVSPEAILDALKSPLQVIDKPNGTRRYVGKDAVVVLNSDGSVVTVWGQ